MGNFTGSTTVDAEPHAVFEYLSDVQNLPRYFARMITAEPGDGEEVRTTARTPNGQEVQGTAWFRVDDDAQRIEWGSEGPDDYHGHLQVRPVGDGAEVEVHLHTTRVAGRNREVHEGIEETLSAVKQLVESGRPASEESGTTARQTAAEESSGPRQQAEQLAGSAQEAAAATAETTERVLRAPLAVAGQLVSDLADGARRPDAVLYWGGLAGAAVLGAIEWPVAVAIGVGVAVARARRTTG